MSYGSLSHRKQGGIDEIHLFGILPAGKGRQHVESERNTMFDECFTYDDELRKKRAFAGGEALQPTNAAVSVYSKNGKVAVTDGRSVRGNEGAIGWDSGA
jgi:hypothetical protein